MIDTILFDLDGTLLKFTQKAFIGAYFKELTKVFIKLGFDGEESIKAVWAGTKAMMLNDGSELNTKKFWQGFAAHMSIAGQQLDKVEAACDSFYTNEFNSVKSIIEPSDIPKRLIKTMAAKGYGIVLATNPLFPLCAVESRLAWAGLDANDYLLITHYANSTFCKPNPGYFKEIFSKINKTPQQCIMVGNNPAEDMVAGTLGAETYLVTDCLENESDMDITPFRRGRLSELEEYLNSLPALPQQ